MIEVSQRAMQSFDKLRMTEEANEPFDKPVLSKAEGLRVTWLVMVSLSSGELVEW